MGSSNPYTLDAVLGKVAYGLLFVSVHDEVSRSAAAVGWEMNNLDEIGVDGVLG